jgi:hypothetical protein
MIIVSTLNTNYYNKNYIIASNLASEQLELYKNIRDSNYKIIKKFNQINPSKEYTETYTPLKFEINTEYKIYNDFSASASFPIKVEKISGFAE